jgi:hypothetical protein
VKIGTILRAQQLDIYNKLNSNGKKKERKSRKDSLSFNYIEKLMQSNKGVDERKC